MGYLAAADRYQHVGYRRCGSQRAPAAGRLAGPLAELRGRPGPRSAQRAVIHRAFDLGITHFDLANNYGPPSGSAETNFGRILPMTCGSYRDELIISTKAGYDMWPGPYGNWGSRKYLLARLDRVLARMGLEYVDIFYSHRSDPETPLEETMAALAHRGHARARRCMRGSRPIRPSGPRRPPRSCAAWARRCSSSSRPTRCSTDGSRAVCWTPWPTEGVGCIAFSPLAQGLLTGKYLDGVPAGSRAASEGSFSPGPLTDEHLARVRGLNDHRRRAAARRWRRWRCLGAA